MKKLIAIFAVSLVCATALAQQINYGVGAVFGRSELYGVVGAQLFPLFPKWKVNAEAVTYTPFAGVSQESPAFGGFGATRLWEQPEGHAFGVGASVLSEIGNGWHKVGDLYFGIYGRVRF